MPADSFNLIQRREKEGEPTIPHALKKNHASVQTSSFPEGPTVLSEIRRGAGAKFQMLAQQAQGERARELGREGRRAAEWSECERGRTGDAVNPVSRSTATEE